jgi:fibronectin type III domain protein
MTRKKQIDLSFVIRIIVFLHIIFTPAAVLCGQIGMSWDKSMGPDVYGYRVFCREETSYYDYSQPSWQSADTRCVITDIDENKIYYAVVRAYNAGGAESRNSNEVSFQPCQSYPLLSENFFYVIVMEGETVILDYVDNLEKDYTIASYNWAQIEGSPVVLSDPYAAIPTFTAPSVVDDSAELKFIVGIKTTDNLCDTAEISITIESDGARSVASANPKGSGGCFISEAVTNFFG